MTTFVGTAVTADVSVADVPPNAYCSYEDLKSYLRITRIDDDTLLKSFCGLASRLWDQATRRRFYPLTATRYFDHPWNDTILVLDDDLLEVSVFTTDNAGITLAASDYYLMCGDEHNVTPYDRIAMRIDGDHTSLEYQTTPQRANAVAGIWGYHEDWANAWQAVDALAAGINASVTSLTVADADGADLDGITPRFKVQQIIKIGTEHLYVTGKNVTTNVLTVRRGINGTIAAVHDAAAAVSIYRPMEDIYHIVRRLAAWLYGQKDTPYSERIQAAQQGIISMPEGLPADVRLAVARYAR